MDAPYPARGQGWTHLPLPPWKGSRVKRLLPPVAIGKKNLDDLILSILASEDLNPNRTRARLIQQIYEVDSLTCPKCQGQMVMIM